MIQSTIRHGLVALSGAARQWQRVKAFDLSVFQKSVWGWSGWVAERLFVTDLDDPDLQELWELATDALDYDEMSVTDRKVIQAYRWPYRSLKAAVRIINRRRERVVELARGLKEHDQLEPHGCATGGSCP